jgi:hypothetical protein
VRRADVACPREKLRSFLRPFPLEEVLGNSTYRLSLLLKTSHLAQELNPVSLENGDLQRMVCAGGSCHHEIRSPEHLEDEFAGIGIRLLLNELVHAQLPLENRAPV